MYGTCVWYMIFVCWYMNSKNIDTVMWILKYFVTWNQPSMRDEILWNFTRIRMIKWWDEKYCVTCISACMCIWMFVQSVHRQVCKSSCSDHTYLYNVGTYSMRLDMPFPVSQARLHQTYYVYLHTVLHTSYSCVSLLHQPLILSPLRCQWM